MSSDEALKKEYVQGLARGLEVIRAFTSETPRMTVADVANKTGMTRATARRGLLTLEALGYAERDKRQFMLTPKILSLGYSFLSSQRIDENVEPLLREVTDRLGESCSLGMLEDDRVVYVARSPAQQRLLSIRLNVGSTLPVLVTSMGRAIVAFIDDERRERLIAHAPLVRHTEKTVTDRAELRRIIEDVRRNGYAIVDEELEIGLRSMAVPVRTRSGRTVAAVNVSASASRVSIDTMRETFLPVLRRCAEKIAHAIE